MTTDCVSPQSPNNHPQYRVSELDCQQERNQERFDQRKFIANARSRSRYEVRHGHGMEWPLSPARFLDNEIGYATPPFETVLHDTRAHRYTPTMTRKW